MSDVRACVFNIQKFCTNDGPGIRTTVFLKGCPLDCMWCHNPESKSRSPQLSYNRDKCVKCGACVDACPNGAHIINEEEHTLNRDVCRVCGKCADVCAAKALEIIGKEMSADEIMEEVLADRPFYGDDGGITISGGEPFYSFDMLTELLKRSKEAGITTCVETSGLTSEENILAAAEYVDTFLFDCKHTDGELHKKYTGVSNEQIRKNLLAVDKTGARIILRCPIIPGINDNSGHLDNVAQLAQSLENIVRVELMAYHSLGESKADNTGAEYAVRGIPSMTNEEIEKHVEYISKKTAVPVKRG